MSQRSVVHASFTLERTYEAAPRRVFDAFAQRAAKAKWFAGGEDFTTEEYRLDFQVGQRERWRGRHRGGPVVSFDSLYQDIVPNERIVLTYDMHLDKTRISVSLLTLEFILQGKNTKLILTEQDVFLDDFDNVASREKGTRDLLDNLDAFLSNSTVRS